MHVSIIHNIIILIYITYRSFTPKNRYSELSLLHKNRSILFNYKIDVTYRAKVKGSF